VEPTLQLPSHPDIYAAGDVIDWAEQKQAAKYTAHAAVVVANILNVVAGQTPVTKYKGSLELIVVTDGKVRFIASFRVEPCLMPVSIHSCNSEGVLRIWVCSGALRLAPGSSEWSKGRIF
jgi:NADH dehydrogenase FAD-containing subunit